VGRILESAGVNVTRTLRSAHDEEAGGPVIDLEGEDSGLLIGRRGQTLQALQFLVTLIVRKQLGEDVRVILDVENYRQRRETSLRDMATKVATRVAQTSRSITLEPMSPADRRIIHTALAEHPEVRTESAGEGENRKVTIMPRRD
jgi:spoIIIJ-associated protein